MDILYFHEIDFLWRMHNVLDGALVTDGSDYLVMCL